MKTVIVLSSLFLVAGCQQGADKTSEVDRPGLAFARQLQSSAEDSLTLMNDSIIVPAGGPYKLPPISIFSDTLYRYTDELQERLDRRNKLYVCYQNEMTLLSAGIGQDASEIVFRDAQDKIRRFAGWLKEANVKMRVLEEENENLEEVLADAEKGRKFLVTYGLQAYWSWSGGEVVEEMIVRKLQPL